MINSFNVGLSVFLDFRKINSMQSDATKYRSNASAPDSKLFNPIRMPTKADAQSSRVVINANTVFGTSDLFVYI